MNMDGSPSGFPGQLVAVLEALARAAVDEMNRCVEDGTAVLRLELSRSRSDIDGLKRKCDALEEQLRSSRRSSRRSRAQRRSRTPAGAETLTPPENNNTAWETQSVDGDPDEEVLIKEESTDFSDAGESSYFDVAQTADSAELHHDVYGAAAVAGDQRPDGEGAELAVKHEEDEDAEDAGCHGDAWSSNGNTVVDSRSNGNAVVDLWSSNGNVDSRSSNGNAVVDLRSNGNAVVDSRSNGNAVVDSWSNGNAVVDSWSNGNADSRSNGNAVVDQRSESPRQKTKRRARTFGYRRPQPDDDRGTAPPANRADSPPQNAASSFYGGGGFAVSRMRAWTAFGGDKRFGCTFCDKNFVRFSQLKEHLRSHTGEKPFACAQCGRSFTKQCNLIRHAVVHSGEKPYACAQCGKRFTQRSSLKSHQKTVH